ncbi:type III pantothenate kinase [Luteolibacter pohnpeiensis]|uniref:Type III pantothenate kinase n=1 Tax=Luteolibacter pohnpeiensis TaxID=454153 RepID=A0A934VRK6_9BACT|nr:type III pantothenate kinase [Luteolibacter pohnpeiensis]MBK1883311.1 type III pantothenate kinase [Luteolibacter pohnpeiensis]
MSWLLIDNSNTRTKFALADESGLLEWRGVIATPDISQETLLELLQGVDYHGVLIGSVVPLKRDLMAEFFRDAHPLHLLDYRSPLGIGIDYPNPQQIGADRLANAVGVMARHGTPAVVIDFGTAVTFDVVSAAPAYLGGVIAPGLGAMSGYLTRKTALLPEVDLVEPDTAIGKSTVQAMQAGAVFGYRGLVRGILAEILKELPENTFIVATGGDAALIAKGVSEISAVDRDLTLDGLRHVACRVFSESR